MSGRTRPLVLFCAPASPPTTEPEDEAARSLLVKAVGLPEITGQALFNEAVGNLLARRLGLEPPEVCLTILTEQFVRAVERQLANDGLRIEAGMAVGTKFIRGLANFVPGAAPSAEELDQMTLLYAFDMIVQNPDRRLDNPNCGLLDGRLVPYDFEMCFSFVMALGSPDPCAISTHGLAPRHCCHDTLRSRKASVSWKPMLDALESLTDEELQRIVSAVPPQWQNAADRVRTHVSTVRDKLDIVELELQRSLG
jgi:hypothetical protein